MGSIIVELWAFMRERKKFWLLPILIMMVIFGGLIVMTKGRPSRRSSTAVLGRAAPHACAGSRLSTTTAPRR
jgi:hypothetical protein